METMMSCQLHMNVDEADAERAGVPNLPSFAAQAAAVARRTARRCNSGACNC